MRLFQKEIFLDSGLCNVSLGLNFHNLNEIAGITID